MNLNPVEMSYDSWIAPIIREEARSYMAKVIPIIREAKKRYTASSDIAFEYYPHGLSDLVSTSPRDLDELVDIGVGLRTTDKSNEIVLNLGLCNTLAHGVRSGLQVNFGRVGESWWDHNFASFANGGIQINYGAVGGYFGWCAEGGIQINLGKVYGIWDEDRFMVSIPGMGSSSSISLNLGEVVMPSGEYKQYITPEKESKLGKIFATLLRLKEPSTSFEDAVQACMCVLDYKKFESQLQDAIKEYKMSQGLGNDVYLLNFGSIFEDRTSMFASHRKNETPKP